MKNVKRVVIYPRPKDVDAFEHVYQLSMCPWLLRGWQNQDDCNKIRLPFIASQRFTLRRCKLWKNAQLRMAGKKRWPMPPRKRLSISPDIKSIVSESTHGCRR